jgi:hypothetical protein
MYRTGLPAFWLSQAGGSSPASCSQAARDQCLLTDPVRAIFQKPRGKQRSKHRIELLRK